MTTARSALELNRRLSRWPVFVIALICALPLIMAMILRFIISPRPTDHVAKSLVPSIFPYESFYQSNGRPIAQTGVREHWLIVHVESGICASACRYAMYLTRQARMAQGGDSVRIQRIWIISDKVLPSHELLAANPDLLVLHSVDPQSIQQFMPESLTSSPVIHLVDRRGYVVFRYDATVDPNTFIRELSKLVRF